MLVSEVVQKSVVPVSLSTLLVDINPENYPDNLQYLPVVEDEAFKGFLSLADLPLDQELNELVGQCDLEQVNESISPNQHIFEVMVLFQKSALSVLPVLDEEKRYEGIVQLDRILNILAGSYAFQSEGAILVLSVAAIDYSLAEISRLVESNQAKILAVMVEADSFTHDKLLVHMRINQPDLSRVVATLERFSYHVVEVHHTTEVTSLDQERLDQLMKYLGI